MNLKIFKAVQEYVYSCNGTGRQVLFLTKQL